MDSSNHGRRTDAALAASCPPDNETIEQAAREERAPHVPNEPWQDAGIRPEDALQPAGATVLKSDLREASILNIRV